MRRREFIAGLGSAAAWPIVARAQQPERMRRIGVLGGGRRQLLAFTQALADLGWTVGRNVRMIYPRFFGDDINLIRHPDCTGDYKFNPLVLAENQTGADTARFLSRYPSTEGAMPDRLSVGLHARAARPILRSWQSGLTVF
jgi:hypothetical protein